MGEYLWQDEANYQLVFKQVSKGCGVALGCHVVPTWCFKFFAPFAGNLLRVSACCIHLGCLPDS